MGRRQFQTGPSRFSLTEAAQDGRFYVREEFWLMGRNDEEDAFEDHGPFTRAEAERQMGAMKKDRG